MAVTRSSMNIGIFALSIVVRSAISAFAQGVGAIGGIVTDTSGAELPGVAVTLASSQGTIGGNHETVSDARGAYEFLRLVPGKYTVWARRTRRRTSSRAAPAANPTAITSSCLRRHW